MIIVKIDTSDCIGFSLQSNKIIYISERATCFKIKATETNSKQPNGKLDSRITTVYNPTVLSYEDNCFNIIGNH